VKQIRKRLTYANVMSSIAVFLVLGGATAFAAGQLGKNTVGSKQLKKNAVTAAKIKKGAITGDKIKLSSLGTVPSATNATNAANATNATNAVNATNATNFSRYFTSGVVKASPGQNVALFTSGPFSFVGHCKDIGGGEVEAVTILTTNQSGSAMAAYEDEYYEFDFNPGEEAELGYPVSGSTDPEVGDYGTYDYTGFSAESADAKTLLKGKVDNAINVYGSRCAFWMEVTNES
jgi:hypothetical protein